MNADPHELRLSFGAAAPAYAQHRPDYAVAAIEWALEPAPGRRVLDLGAGTGKLTSTLVGLGYEVIAVEPDSAMLAELRDSVPAAHALPGSAEAIPVPDGGSTGWPDLLRSAAWRRSAHGTPPLPGVSRWRGCTNL